MSVRVLEITPAQAATNDAYNQLRLAIQERFSGIARSSAPIFTTEAPDNLFDIFLFCLPEGETRQHYTCNACRNFINRFGGLVVLDQRGNRRSAIWPDECQPVFALGVSALLQRAMDAPISGVLVSAEKNLGQPVTGEWSHFSAELPRQRLYPPTRLKSLEAAQAEKIQEYQMIKRALADFPSAVVLQAYGWLKAGQLPRSEKFVDLARWFLDLQSSLEGKQGKQLDDLVWLASATAPAGFCHIRGGMLGTLLQDIAAGKSFEECKREFSIKLDPGSYMRAQVAPDAGNIRRAEAIIEELGLAKSLDRRYARLSDIQAIWAAKAPERRRAEAPAPGVFAHLEPKQKAPEPAAVSATDPASTMTWEKFRSTVLPDAATMDLLIPRDGNRFAALVTAQDPASPPLLQWDHLDARNPVSWYYHAGVDAEIRERVTKAGGMHEGVDLRCSLIWNNRNDLDLHCITPNGQHIFFGDKRPTRSGGWLDVDMNVRGETTKPVENIRWSKGTAPAGKYRFYVLNYNFHEPRSFPTPFRVELEVNGAVYAKSGEIPPMVEHRSNIRPECLVFEIDFVPGIQPANLQPQGGSVEGWGVTPGTWTKINAVALSPNLWGDKPQPHHGRHVFFLLEGCRDSANGKGRGFFPEALKAELREVRATLEAYAAKATIAGTEEAQACGIGFKDGSPGWEAARIRVTDRHKITTVFQLDRWD